MTAPSPLPPRRLGPRELTLIRQALGLSGRYRRSYRNYFTVPEDADDHRVWCGLVAEGFAVLARRNRVALAENVFRLTYRGAVLALRPGETLDLDHFPEARA